jgi:Kae1-associated kinase Bud32
MLNRQCAEAIVKEFFKDEKKLVSKKRIKKNYRDEKIDFLIRKKRTRIESKIIIKLKGIINLPEIISVDEKNYEIIMTFINGKLLKDAINKNKELCFFAGQEIKKIHEHGIIHGDLTTSNIIYNDFEKKLYFIDFGLGFFSKKIEDKATDLIVFKKTFNATHSNIKKGWELVLRGYNPEKELLERMEKVEKRARYH